MNNKKYLSISEVSEKLNIKPHVIRYWDSKFNGISTRSSNKKQRFFNSDNIKKLEEFKNILYQNGKHNYSLDLANKLADNKVLKNKKNSLTNKFIDNKDKIFFDLLKSISMSLKKIL